MRFLPLLAVICLWTAGALAQPITPASIPRTVNLPVVGLASSETAQVNVVSLAPSFMSYIGANSSSGQTASCTGVIAFYDSSGTAIGSSTPFTIGSGEISSATVAYSAIVAGDKPPTGNGRTVVRAVVTINGANSSDAPCTLASNIETFDTMTGVTHIHVEGATTGIFPNLLNFSGRSQSGSR